MPLAFKPIPRRLARFALAAAIASFAAGAVLAACGFPSPELRDVADADENDALDAAADEPRVVLVDGSDPDAFIVEDAGVKIDGGDCGDADCDCDNDTFKDPSKTGCVPDGGVGDCDDLDSRARPGQSYLEAPPEPPTNGNWNCTNEVEKLFPANVSCGLLAVGACNGVQGFSGDPACGEEGEYVFCEATLVLCGAGDRTTRKQACR